MAIVASIIAGISPQRDGRRWIEERHTDHTGLTYLVRYLAEADLDLAAALAARAIQIGGDLAAAEVRGDIARIVADGSLATLTMVYATLADIRSALRDVYRSATRAEAIMLGDFLATLTDAQLRTLFAMTQAEVNTLRTNKLGPAASAAATIRTAAGT